MSSQSTASPQDQPKSTRKINRSLASCSACRLKRTRCDRTIPCAACEKRKSECSYEGARHPSILATRRATDREEQEQYVRELEQRIRVLEQAKTPCPATESTTRPVPIDFGLDDLTHNLSQITLGPRLRAPKPQHHLQAEVETLIASSSNRPAVFFAQTSFNMSLIPNGPPTTIESLRESLPSPKELADLAVYFFAYLNSAFPSIEPSSWPDAVLLCYDLHDGNRITPEDIHRFAAVLAVAAHGLLYKASINLDAWLTPHHQQQTARAHRWFHLALGALQLEEGAIFTRPTVWGIRAMALLANAQFSPQDLDHGLFFWSLTTNLAATVGLFNEPPGFDAKEVTNVELESRRQMAWAIWALNWAGEAVVGQIRQPVDFTIHPVKLPGTVDCVLDPNDGWPVDPLLAMRRACALCDRALYETTSKLLTGRSATYDELLEVERSILAVEKSLPDRLALDISPDRLSVRPRLSHDPSIALMCYSIWQRLSVVRLRVHRPFLFPKDGVPESEHRRHMHALEFVCRRHLLICGHLPHVMMMHPLVLYSYTNTALSCGIALLAYPDILDASFFISELHKLLAIFATAQKTVSSSLASSASTVISYMIERARQKDPRAPPPLKRANGSFHTTPRSSPNSTDAEDLRHKSPSTKNSGSEEGTPCDLRVHSPERHQRPIRHFPALEQTSEQMAPQIDDSPHVASVPVSDYAYSSGESPDRPIIDLNAMSRLPFTFRPPSPFPDMGTSSTQPSSSRPSLPYGGNTEEQSFLSDLFDPQVLELFRFTSTQSSLAGTPQDSNTQHPPRQESRASHPNTNGPSNHVSHERRDYIPSFNGASGGNSVNMISPPMNSGPMTPFTSPSTQVELDPNPKQPFNYESRSRKDRVQSWEESSGRNSVNMSSPSTNPGPMTPFASPPIQAETHRVSKGSFNNGSHETRYPMQSLERSSGGSSVNVISPSINSGPMTPFTSSAQVEISDGGSGVGGEELFWSYIRGKN